MRRGGRGEGSRRGWNRAPAAPCRSYCKLPVSADVSDGNQSFVRSSHPHMHSHSSTRTHTLLHLRCAEVLWSFRSVHAFLFLFFFFATFYMSPNRCSSSFSPLSPLHSSQLSGARTKDVIGGCRHRQEVCFLSLQSKHSEHSTSQDSTRKRRLVPQLIRSFISAIRCL